jgi:hypothetical protein
MSHFKLSRRSILSGVAATGGAALGTRFGGPFAREAFAQAAKKPALVVIYLQGGYNAVFSSADSFAASGAYGVTAGNQLDLTNGLIVDKIFDALPAMAKQKMATVGVNHGVANHGGANANIMTVSGQNAAVSLAAALGGNAPIKAANVGQARIAGPQGVVGGVSLQIITDMKATLDALGASAVDPNKPKREIAAPGVAAAQVMSMPQLDTNKSSLASVRNGLTAAIDTLKKPAEVFNIAEFSAAYGLGNSLAVGNLNSQFAAAELMIRAGTNVVTAIDGVGGVGQWDTHGDRNGTTARNMMTSRVMPGLITFSKRMLASADRNVAIVILGDFARSLPGSDHGSLLSATVIGDNVKPGTTGKVTAQVGLPTGSPASAGLWAYLAAILRAPPAAVAGFGPNPHTIITG